MTVTNLRDEAVEYEIYKTPSGWALACWHIWASRKHGKLGSVMWRRYYPERDKAEESLERILGATILDGQWTNERGTWVRMKAG